MERLQPRSQAHLPGEAIRRPPLQANGPGNEVGNGSEQGNVTVLAVPTLEKEQKERTRGFNMAEGVATVYQCANCKELFALMLICTHKCHYM